MEKRKRETTKQEAYKGRKRYVPPVLANKGNSRHHTREAISINNYRKYQPKSCRSTCISRGVLPCPEQISRRYPVDQIAWKTDDQKCLDGKSIIHTPQGGSKFFIKDQKAKWHHGKVRFASRELKTSLAD